MTRSALQAELSSPTQFDVLVVGGGPAGSTLARVLRQCGMAVCVLDKAQFPRQKVCAGWVTPAVMQELEIDLEAYGREYVLQPIHSFRTGQIGQQPVQSDYPGEPVSFGIRRTEFDNFLLRRCGAELMLGQALDSLKRENGGWLVNESIRANLVVGAGGHFCPVARNMGGLASSEIAVAAQEIEFEMSPEQKAVCPVEGDIPELFFTPDLKGYGWVFRKGDYLNIGLGREDKHKLTGHVKRFCEELQAAGRIPQELPEKFRGHAYLLYHHARRRLLDDGILLVGDAAGLAYPQSGEGIRPAVESALLAAQAIVDCDGDYRRENLRPYVDRLEARFGQREPAPGLLDKLPAGFRQAVARLLMKNHWFSRNILTTRWFLHAQDEPLPPRVKFH
jgi:geranylgeranyl reductase family protein